MPGSQFRRTLSDIERLNAAADALVLGTSKPGAVSSSKDKTFAEVAADARKRMDEKYALMTASGKPYTGSDEDRTLSQPG